MIVLPALRVHIGKAETLIHLRDVKAGDMVVILGAQRCRWLVGWPTCNLAPSRTFTLMHASTISAPRRALSMVSSAYAQRGLSHILKMWAAASQAKLQSVVEFPSMATWVRKPKA